MTRILVLLWSVLLLLVVTGCATNPASAAHKAGLKSVRLDEHIMYEDAMRYGVDLSGTGDLTQFLAARLMNAAGEGGIERMSNLMRSNEIDVVTLVRERTQHHFQLVNGLELATEGGDGILVLAVKQHGFGSPTLKLAKKAPFVALGAAILDRNGKRVWRGHTGPMDLNSEALGATWEEYEADPNRLREDWIKQIDHVLARLFPNADD